MASLQSRSRLIRFGQNESVGLFQKDAQFAQERVPSVRIKIVLFELSNHAFKVMAHSSKVAFRNFGQARYEGLV